MDQVTEAKARASSAIDVESKTLTLKAEDGSEATFNIGDLPTNAIVFMAARGVALRLGKHVDPAAAWADLVAGKLPTGKSSGKASEPTISEQATALAVRDELAAQAGVKKSDKVAYAELLTRAAAIVSGWDRAKKTEARQSSAVLAHIAVLKAAATPPKSLLDLAA